MRMHTANYETRRLLHPFIVSLVLAFATGALAGEPVKEPTAVFHCPEGMIVIPGGSFRLVGKGKIVSVRAFFLGLTAGSAGLYEECVDRDLCSAKKLFDQSWGTYVSDPEHPINYVTWAQADAYCEARDRRLPTEAEWEWAARGGPAGNTYPWGNDPPSKQLCWSGKGNDSGKEERERTCPVYAHPGDVTPQGVLGMGGNVFEWTSTRSGVGHVIRGGSWGTTASEDVAVSLRIPMMNVTFRSPHLGFRCARNPMP